MHSSIKNFLKYINEYEDYELIDISDENGNIKVVCEFCKTERIFSSFN